MARARVGRPRKRIEPKRGMKAVDEFKQYARYAAKKAELSTGLTQDVLNRVIAVSSFLNEQLKKDHKHRLHFLVHCFDAKARPEEQTFNVAVQSGASTSAVPIRHGLKISVPDQDIEIIRPQKYRGFGETTAKLDRLNKALDATGHRFSYPDYLVRKTEGEISSVHAPHAGKFTELCVPFLTAMTAVVDEGWRKRLDGAFEAGNQISPDIECELHGSRNPNCHFKLFIK